MKKRKRFTSVVKLKRSKDLTVKKKRRTKLEEKKKENENKKKRMYL